MEVRTHRSVAWGATVNWLAFAATLAVAFFLAPYLIRRLGAARYGVWCVVEAVLAYFTLFDLGIAAGLVRHVARCHTLRRIDELSRLVSAAVLAYGGAAGGVLLLGVPVLLGMAPRLEASLVPGMPPQAMSQAMSSQAMLSQAEPLTPFLLLMLLQLAMSLPLSVFPTLLDGVQRFGIKSLVRLGALAGRVGGIVWVMETGPALTPLAGVYLVTSLAEHLVMAWAARRSLPGLRFSWRLADRSAWREIRRSSVDAFVAMVAGRVTGQTAPIVAGLMLSSLAAAHYAVAARLVEMAKSLLRAATTTLTPAVSARDAAGATAELQQLFLTASRVMLYLALPIGLGVWFCGSAFLRRWLGDTAFAAAAYPAAAVLAGTLPLGVAQSVAARVLYGLGQLRWFARLAMLEAAVHLAAALVLAPVYGLIGLALAAAVPNVLFCLGTLQVACQAVGLDMGRYWRESWRRPLLAATVPAVVWGLLQPLPASWPALCGAGVLGLVPYAAAIVLLERTWRHALWRQGRRLASRWASPSRSPRSQPLAEKLS